MFTTNKKRGLILLSVIIAALLCLVGAFMLAPQKKAAIAEDGDPLLPDTHAHTNAYTGDDMENDGSYYLNGNATGGISVTGNVTLCLNGHNISGGGSVITVEDGGTLTLCDCQGTGKITGCDVMSMYDGGGVRVKSGGAFVMTSGKISGNNKPFGDGGGVYVADNASFTMTGGEISNNMSVGGGVYVAGGTFTMTGGTISENINRGTTITGGTPTGGGVWVAGGTFNISGSPNITGNDGNVYLTGNSKITVTGALTDGAQIGVNQYILGALTTGYGEHNKDENNQVIDPNTYFTADDEMHKIVLESGEAKLVPVVATVTVGEGEPTKHISIEDAWTAANTAGTATVKMFADATTTATLTVISGKNITLDLNGYMIKYNGSAANSVITVKGTLTLQDSPNSNSVGHNYNSDNDFKYWTFNDSGAKTYNGGVIAGGKFVNGSPTVYGGGGSVDGGTFIMRGGAIAGNRVSFGGGVSVNGGTFVMENGKVIGNYSDYEGGGVYVNNGTFTMMDGEISENYSISGGGGVKVSSSNGTFEMTSGTITNNGTSSNGSGVAVYGTFKVSGAVNITGNKISSNRGGNVYLADGKTITVTGALTHLDDPTQKAQIGVRLYGSTGAGDIATGFPQNDDPSEFFIPDNTANNCVYVSAEESGTVSIGTHDFDWAHDDKNHWHECINCGKTQNEGPHNLVNGECECGYVKVADVAQVMFNGATTAYGTVEGAFAYANSLTTTEKAPAVITLLDNATTTDTLTVEEGKYITLDLNGYMLKYNNDSAVCAVITVDGNFTLEDSNTDTAKKHEIPDPDNSGETIEVIGGLITGGNDGGVHVNGSDSVFVMKGGKICGNTSHKVMYGDNGGTETESAHCAVGGVYVHGGTFTMSGGSISDNSASNSTSIELGASVGGVRVVDDGEFIMSGGSISDNTAMYGGVCVVYGGKFTMTGGTISGNTAQENGGVCVGHPWWDDGQGSSFEISGAPVITGNKVVIDGNEVENNVVVQEGYKITVAGTLTEGAKIGVYNNGVIATGFTQGDNPSQYFIPDNPAYNCVYVSDKDTTGTVTIGEHNYSEDFTIDVQPTCTEAGSKSKHCSGCDEKIEVTEIDKLGHSFGEFVVDKQPTCTAEGSKSKHCANCDEKTDVTDIDPLGHTLNYNPAAPATNDQNGNIEFWDCEDCNKFFADEDGKEEITDRMSIIIPKLVNPITGGGISGTDILWITLIVVLSTAILIEVAVIVYRAKRKAKNKK